MKTSFKDSVTCQKYLTEIVKKMQQKGYVLFSIDSIDRKGNDWFTHMYIGPRFELLQISTSPDILQFIEKNSSLKEQLISELPFKKNEIFGLMTTINSTYINNGYPFAEVRLDSITFDGEIPKAKLFVEKGPQYTIQKIVIKGDSNIQVKMIQNLIEIKSGDIHNENRIRKIDRRIGQITYLRTIKPSEILFRPEGTEVYMYLEKTPVSSLNGIVGFQPNSVTGKLDVTGEVNLKLTNSLNRGEKIFLQWQSIRSQTQNLNTSVLYPYLFNSRFGVEGSFDLYKRDSTFLELKFISGVNYYFTNSTYVKAFYQGYRSNSLSGSTNNASFNSIGNSSINLYGLGLNSTELDYVQNPRKGYAIEISAGIGNRLFRDNDTSEIQKTLSYRGNLSVEFFVPLYKKHVLRLANQSEFTGSEQGLFENELYRFGGQQSQRGFNEDELFSSTRSTQIIEYRYLLDRDAYVFLFFDQTWYENNASNYYSDRPFGFGTGFSFATGWGIFSLSYALGKQFDNPIRLADGKIHFGYIAYF